MPLRSFNSTPSTDARLSRRSRANESPAFALPSKEQMHYTSANPVTTPRVTTRHDFA